MQKISRLTQRIKPWQYIILVFGLIFLFHLWSLMRYPGPHVDEVWLISRSWSYAHTGRVFGILDQGVFDRFDGYWTFFPWLQTWFFSIILKMAGGPTLLPIKLAALLSGMLLLLAVFWIAKPLGGDRLAVIAVVLVGLSSAFLYSSHMARYDIFASTMGYGAIALHLNNHRGRWWISLISGLLAGIALEVHPNSVVFIPVIGFLFLLDSGWKFIKNRQFWFFSFGVMAGLCFYLLLHVWPYPETYKAIMGILAGSYHRPPLLSMDLKAIVQSLFVTGLILIYRFHLLTAILVWQLVKMMRRKTRADLTLSAVAIVLVLVFAVLIKNKFDYYLIYLTPALYLVLASFLVDIKQNLRNKSLRQQAAFIYISTAFLANIFLVTLPLSDNWYLEYQIVQERVNQSVQPADTVMASQIYWLGLTGQDYYSWEQIPYSGWFEPGISLEDRFRQFQPDIFIIDEHIRQFISDDPEATIYSGLLTIPQTDLDLFLSKYAVLVDEFENDKYGPTQVYRIQWE